MNYVDNQPLELDEKDKFEVELYKGIKNDPYFKHYLYNNFAYFAETMNDMIAGSPFISRGHVQYFYNSLETSRLCSLRQTPKCTQEAK